MGWRTGSQCRSRSLRHHLRCSAGGTRAPAHAALQRAMSETRAAGVASSGGGAGSSSLALAMAPAYARPASLLPQSPRSGGCLGGVRGLADVWRSDDGVRAWTD